MPRPVQKAEPPPRIPLRVLEQIEHPAGLVTVRLEPFSFPWCPGDCVGVYLPGSPVSRPYSLSGGVGDPFLELLVRRVDGGVVSPWLCGLKAGDACDVSPPFGWFRPGEPEGADRIFLATGSGIAPFLSALRSGVSPPRALYWGVRDVGDAVFVDELPGVEVFVSRGDPGEWRSGRLTAALADLRMDKQTHVYACGLDRMIDEVAARIDQQGLSSGQLHRECFFTAS